MKDAHHHQDSSVVYPRFVQIHHSSPAILDLIYPIEFDIHPDAVHGDAPDNELGRVYRVILGSLILGVFWEDEMKLGKQL